ncbi:MAG: hypothetical protein M1825_000184 [Sarcosagium campestre]|nr:MAG: hypothetical protein M1825_000184 [Sarcosagium campestre]
MPLTIEEASEGIEMTNHIISISSRAILFEAVLPKTGIWELHPDTVATLTAARGMANMSTGIQKLVAEAVKKKVYTIDILTELNKTLPFLKCSINSFSADAWREQLLRPPVLPDRATIIVPADFPASVSRKLKSVPGSAKPRVFLGVSRSTVREFEEEQNSTGKREQPPHKTEIHKQGGFAEFLKESLRPMGNRVTAGGNIVPFQNPVQGNLPHSQRIWPDNEHVPMIFRPFPEANANVVNMGYHPACSFYWANGQVYKDELYAGHGLADGIPIGMHRGDVSALPTAKPWVPYPVAWPAQADNFAWQSTNPPYVALPALDEARLKTFNLAPQVQAEAEAQENPMADLAAFLTKRTELYNQLALVNSPFWSTGRLTKEELGRIKVESARLEMKLKKLELDWKATERWLLQRTSGRMNPTILRDPRRRPVWENRVPKHRTWSAGSQTKRKADDSDSDDSGSRKLNRSSSAARRRNAPTPTAWLDGASDVPSDGQGRRSSSDSSTQGWSFKPREGVKADERMKSRGRKETAQEGSSPPLIDIVTEDFLPSQMMGKKEAEAMRNRHDRKLAGEKAAVVDIKAGDSTVQLRRLDKFGNFEVLDEPKSKETRRPTQEEIKKAAEEHVLRTIHDRETQAEYLNTKRMPGIKSVTAEEFAEAVAREASRYKTRISIVPNMPKIAAATLTSGGNSKSQLQDPILDATVAAPQPFTARQQNVSAAATLQQASSRMRYLATGKASSVKAAGSNTKVTMTSVGVGESSSKIAGESRAAKGLPGLHATDAEIEAFFKKMRIEEQKVLKKYQDEHN